LFVNVHLGNNDVVLSDDLTSLEGRVTKDVEIQYGGKRNKNRFISIELKEYPKFKFKLGGNSIKATKVNLLTSNVKENDRVKLSIREDQFNKKIANKLPLTFWDKVFNFRIINIYGLSDSK
jgi:hypothetical protein